MGKTTAGNDYRNAILSVTANVAQSRSGVKWKSFVEKQSFASESLNFSCKIMCQPARKSVRL
jgi:hypothetical protein